MDLTSLVRSLLSHDTLSARQWVSDVLKERPIWATVARPEGLSAIELALAAAVAELMAERVQQKAPAWVFNVEGISAPVYLVESAKTLPRLRRLCQEEGPWPLRRRGFLAPPEFLTVA